MAVEEKRLKAAARNLFSEKEGRADGRVKLLRARGSAELRKIASGSASVFRKCVLFTSRGHDSKDENDVINIRTHNNTYDIA